MIRKLLRYYLLLIIVTFGLFVGGVSLIMQNIALNLSRTHALHYLDMVEHYYLNHGENEAATAANFSNQVSFLRITFIDAQGNIVLDSHSQTTENHSDRQELQQLHTVIKRYSTTLEMTMLYVATYLDSHELYLRVSIPIASISSNMTYYILGVSGFALLLILLSYFVFQQFIKKTAGELIKVSRALGQIQDGKYQSIQAESGYSEFDNILRRINKINQQISQNMQELEEEKVKTSFILNNLEQGIVAISNQENLLLFNEAVQQIFKAKDIQVQQHYVLLIRHLEIQQIIQHVLQSGQEAMKEVIIDQAYYRIMVQPLKKQALKIQGVLVLLTNITDLLKADKMKKEFFTNTSHELKSPLTSIIAASELISQGVIVDQKDIQELNIRIHEEATRMKTLVLQMLQLAQLESGKGSQMTTVYLEPLINNVLESLALLAKEKNIQIEVEATNIHLHANEEDLIQLLTNLIENAIRYGKENGHVWIRLKSSSSPRYRLQLSIQDDGIGIAKEHHDRIFERFYRVDKGRNRTSGSTGLGLAIVKHIVLLYQGKIEVVSEVDQGTTFTIWL